MVWVIALSAMDISTHSLSPNIFITAFGVCQELVGGEAPASYQELYLCNALLRQLLKAFRGVRAISQFD